MNSMIGALGVLFVALKLIGIINWSWWLVLLPFYVGLILFVVYMAMLIVAAFVSGKNQM